jgi:hypothetical protein
MNERNIWTTHHALKDTIRIPPLLICGAIVLLLAAVASYYLYRGHRALQPPAPRVIPKSEPSSNAGQREKFKRMVCDAEARLNLEKQRQLEQFKAAISSATSPDYAAAKANIKPAVKKLTGLGSCFKLSYKMAKDKIMGTNDAGIAIENVINRRISGYCVKSARQTDILLGQFQTRAVAGSNQYRTELLQRLQLPEFAGRLYPQALSGRLDAIRQSGGAVKTIAFTSSLTAVSMGADLIFIVAARETLKRVLAAVVNKLAQTAGTAIACSAADGPLPVGDMIGAAVLVGGGIWTAYDLYQARKVLPDKLRTSLNEAVDNFYSTLRRQSIEQAVQLQKSMGDKDHAVAEAMLKQL